MSQSTQPTTNPPQSGGDVDFIGYLNVILSQGWLIFFTTLIVTFCFGWYGFFTRPVYEANMIVQVEDSPNPYKKSLGEMDNTLEIKIATASEMEIIRSRMVASRAVENLHLNVHARPKYFPIIGERLSEYLRKYTSHSNGGFCGYAWGSESIKVAQFDIPTALEGYVFTITLKPNNEFTALQPQLKVLLEGKIGVETRYSTNNGVIDLLISEINGKVGSTYYLSKDAPIASILQLQSELNISEKGKQSGIIAVSLQGNDPKLTTRILQEIGEQYINQNLTRKSEEAQKSIEFLDSQLPKLKQRLEEAEQKFTNYRNQKGTVSLEDEATVVLQQSSEAELKVIELNQKREDLLIRFTPDHPSVVSIDNQIKQIQAILDRVNHKIKSLPKLQQEVLSLERDVKVNTGLYTSLLNLTQQLQLVKAGKIGSVRLIDRAVEPLDKIRPKRKILLLSGVIVGLFLGVLVAFIKNMMVGGIAEAHEIEDEMGLTVFATIPHSKPQADLHIRSPAKGKKKVKDIKRLLSKGLSVLAKTSPNDPAVESLRSMRTAMQFALLGAKNNVILLTGATPNIGKSFIAINYAAVLASMGKNVLIIDADLRRGYLHQYFSLPRENGLSEYIAGANFDEVLHQQVLENCDFLSTGTMTMNPSEVLNQPRLTQLLNILSEQYDYLLIDSPPILAVSDAAIIGAKAGTVLMVARAGVSKFDELKEAMRRFNQAGVSIKGLIFNDYKPKIARFATKKESYRYKDYSY